jgi:hypothetical protein
MLTTTRTLLGLFVSLVGVTACGSSSESGPREARAGAAGQTAAAGTEEQGQSGGNMGEGGDGSSPDAGSTGGSGHGGDTGSGGGTGQGGDTGTDGSAGQGGDTGTGGGAGQGGDTELGSAGRGGSGESGGAASQSDSAGGAAGAAGSGDAVAVGCGQLCSHADDCPDDTEAECLVRCGVLGSKEECDPEYAAFADCLETAEFGCNADGQVSVSGCEGTAAAAVGCIAGIDPDPTLVTPCEEYCEAAVQAQCEKTESQASCVNGCTLFGAQDFPCSNQWEAVLTCSDGKTFECNNNGDAIPSGCAVQVLAFGACVYLGVGASS